MEKIVSYHLPNNLRVIIVDTKTYPSVTGLLLVGAGSRYENKHNNGIAHFFEHMAFKGSKKYPNTRILSSTIEGLGGIFNAFTGKEKTGYWVKAPVAHLETIVDVLADMVKNVLLLPEEIERERGVITEEINMIKDMPQYQVEELYEKLLYQGNPLGFDITGMKETISRFKRQTFLDYMKDYYFPSNAVFIIAGGIGESNLVRKIISKKFTDWQDGRARSYIKLKNKQIKLQTLWQYKKTDQAHFILGFRAFSFFDKRRYAASVLSAILGQGMASRLFYQLRERRGLCYYVSSHLGLYQDAGSFYTQAGVANSPEKIQEAVKLILAEHKKIVAGKLKEEEIRRAKELIKGRLILSMEDSSNLASFYGLKLLLEGRVPKIPHYIKKIEAISRQEIIAVASDIFRSEGLNFALIGPYKKLPLQFDI